MKTKILVAITFIIFNTNLMAETCYEKNRMKTYNLFEKAFKKSNVSIKNLYWMSKQTNTYGGGYSIMMTFDGKLKRGSIFYDKNCNPKNLKVSSGYGSVIMYYYNVNGTNIKLTKTKKNTY